MNGQSVTNNRICGGNVMSQAKIFKLLSEAYGLTWSGGIAAEVIDGCPVTLKEDRFFVSQVQLHVIQSSQHRFTF